MVPEQFGGSGLDTVSYVIVLGEIAVAEATSMAVCLVNNSLVCEIFIEMGNKQTKRKISVSIS